MLWFVQETKTLGLRPYEKKDTPIVFSMLNEVCKYPCTFIDMNFFSTFVWTSYMYSTSSKNVLVIVVNSPLLILTISPQYLGRFDVIPVFQSEEEMEHWILPRQDIISSYVVEVR